MNNKSELEQYISILEELNKTQTDLIENYQKSEKFLKNQISLYKESLEAKDEFIKKLLYSLDVYRSYFR